MASMISLAKLAVNKLYMWSKGHSYILLIAYK